MKKPFLWLTLTLLFGMMALATSVTGQENSSEDEPEQDPDALVCNMPNVEKDFYCIACRTILKGYACRDCRDGKHPKCTQPKNNNKDKTKDEPTYKKPAWLFTEELALGGKICPCCGKDRLGAVDLVDKKDGNKCLVCGVKDAKEEEVCARRTFHCPKHKNLISLTIQTCEVGTTDTKGKNACGKTFIFRTTDRALVNIDSTCPKCGIESSLEGPEEKLQKIRNDKCLLCGAPIKIIKTCAKTGKFPHVNGNLPAIKNLTPEPDTPEETENKN